MDTATTTKNPFGIPELRHRLSQLITNKDALSCALVSKVWTLDFVRTIWLQVEFDVHPQFVDLSPDIIAKHGHYIRVFINATTLEEISAINYANVNRLRHLEIAASTTTTQQESAYQIVTRNNTSLQELILLRVVNYSFLHEHAAYYVSSAAFSPSYDALQQRTPIPKLTSLKIESLILSYSTLESILQVCTNLAKLRLPCVTLAERLNRPFQHLDTWHNVSDIIVPSDRIKAETSRYCPLLTEYKLKYDASCITPQLLANAVTNVTRITFEKEEMAFETISAIVLHGATWKKVALFSYECDYEMDKVNPVSMQIAAFNKMLQLIPRNCTPLEKLNLYPYEMDTDVAEAVEWVCKDLRKLRIRVKELNTKEKILKTIALWRAGCWRRWQKMATGANAVVAVEEEEKQLEEDHSIEARVARHLLKFEQLWWVWLGYKTWTPIKIKHKEQSNATTYRISISP